MGLNDKHNGPVSDPRKPKLNEQRVPGFDLRELVEERNWTALVGLGLLAIGVLYVVDSWLGLDFQLWSLLLIALGGGLALDGWRDYKAAGRTWEDRSRNRIFAGVLVTALGLFGLFELNSWGWLLIILAGWLAYDTWQRYIAAGRMMTPTVRNRFLGAGIMAALGLFGSLNWWSAWPLLLIVLGIALLSGMIGERNR